MIVVRCLLFVFVNRSLSFVVCSLLCVSCLLSVCLLMVVVCGLLFVVVCCLL